MVFGFGKRWNPDGKHVYITGGSSGLGLALAQLLVSKGAHVSIVARNQENLDKALVELEKLRQTPSQILQAQSHSLNSASGAQKALESVCEAHGGSSPDAVFTCAGASKPMFFLEMTEEDLSSGMDNAYWVQAWTAWASAKKMAKEKKTGAKIVLVSSVLGYISFVGYASYSPGKFALRGLADTLHSELMLYGIDVHIFFPPTMPTPGYATEQLTRPEIVKKIEEADEGLTPEQAAIALFEGVQRGDAHITGDLIASLFRASTRGATWRSNRGLGVGVGWVIDGVLDFVAYIATPIWRSSVDNKVLAHRREHEAYLQKKGFFA